MDVFFTDSDEAPVPREEVRVRELEATPLPDGRRVQVRLHLTPFLERPNVEIFIRNSGGEQLAALNVVEALEAQMDFTMHLRETQPRGSFQIQVRVYYAEIEEGLAGEDIQTRPENSVDTAKTSFEL